MYRPTASLSKAVLFLLVSVILTRGGAVNNDSQATTANGVLQSHGLVLEFQPAKIQSLFEKYTTDVAFNYTLAFAGPAVLRASSDNTAIAELVSSATYTLQNHTTGHPSTPEGNTTSLHGATRLLSVRGVFLGRTKISFHLRTVAVVSNSSGEGGYEVQGAGDDPGAAGGHVWMELPVKYSVAIVRKEGAIDKVFMAVVFIFIVFANIGMGCKVDLAVVKQTLKRPVAPVVGLCSQFIFMPLLAFGIAKLIRLEDESIGQALGFFAMGCAPGGGASNMYSYLLDGDVSLSVTMTLLSTAVSLGMIPFWLFTLGQVFLEGTDIQIPFTNIIISLISILVPVAIGILIQKKRPRVAKIILKLLAPVFVVLILFFFTVGIYANLYMFKLFTPKLMIAGCLLPYAGFFLGGITALICRQPWDRIKTIAIETGIQNTGVAIVLMKFSLPQPDADMSIAAPVASSSFTPFPLWIAVAIHFIYYRKCCCCKKAAEPEPGVVNNDDDGYDSTGDEERKLNNNANGKELEIIEARTSMI